MVAGPRRTVLFEESVREELDRLIDYVESIRQPLNGAVAAINERPSDTQEGRKQLREVRRLADAGEERFGELATDEERSVLLPVKKLLKDEFELLQQAADAVEDVVEFDEKHHGTLSLEEVNARNEVVNRLNVPVNSYNEKLGRLQERIEAALNELFGAR